MTSGAFSYPDICLTMRDSMDYHALKWEEIILPVGLATNRLLARGCNLLTLLKCAFYAKNVA
jgi:hypothetical protein